MAYLYKHFIPQNTAPSGATSIGVYDKNGKEVCSIPLGHLSPLKNRTKLYSVGIVADVHFDISEKPSWDPKTKFNNALSYFEGVGCEFCCVSGDMTQTGFYPDGQPSNFTNAQFNWYKQVCEAHTIPVYELCGNHESYVNNITKDLSSLATYTGSNIVANGEDLYFTVKQGNDVYIFLSQPSGGTPMTDNALKKCYQILEENRNNRCFVFVHSYLDCGNVNNIYGNNLFGYWSRTLSFKNLLTHYKNTMLFHGHSHFMFECQEIDRTVNYNESTGFRSVHVPSLSRPAYVSNGSRVGNNALSYCHVMDVYDDCIVLNGIDLINNKPVPLGTFKIDFKLQTIEEGTFWDTAGYLK